MAARRNPHNPHFFAREPDGSVRLRMRLTAEEASLIEEAAGSVPLLLFMHRALSKQAKFHIQRAREGRPVLLGPEEGEPST